MPKRLPIKIARDIGKKSDLKQVIIIAWDGTLTHVVTWGKTLDDCIGAAAAGNAYKVALGFPPEKCKDMPARAKKEVERREAKLMLQAAAAVLTCRW